MTLVSSPSSIGIVDARGEVVDVVEDHRAALVAEETRIGRRVLHHRTVRAEVALEDHERAALVERAVGGANHLGVDDLGTRDVLAQGPAGDRQRLAVEQSASWSITAGSPPA